MKIVSLSNLDKQNTAHGSAIMKQVMLHDGDIPHLTQYAQATFPPGQQAGTHVHPDMWETFLVQKGQGTAVVNGREYPLVPGDSITVEPGEEHDFRNTGTDNWVLMYFSMVPSASTHQPEYWIEQLSLEPHPEGGWYRETYRATDTIAEQALPERFTGPRSLATHIHFLLNHAHFSAFHRIKSDELWCFHIGTGLTVHVIDAQGAYHSFRLGYGMEKGDLLHAVVPAESWFAAEVTAPEGYALVGCTVMPGFDFKDFEIADCGKLCDLYPQHTALITRLTR